MFQHKLFFNLVKDVFYFEGLIRIVNFEIQSESKRVFDVAGLREKESIRCQISSSKNSLFTDSTKIVFQPFQGFIQLP